MELHAQRLWPNLPFCQGCFVAVPQIDESSTLANLWTLIVIAKADCFEIVRADGFGCPRHVLGL